MTARLLIIGAPGAGKGTQAEMLAEAYQVPAISTGDIFRTNIKEGTELGLQVQAIIERGELVPDEVTSAIVADRLNQADAAAGFLLDGYPRTVEQVADLDKYLAAQGKELDAVVLLEADTEAVVQRLLKRAAQQGRADDNEETIRHRQRVYAEQTAPLVELFEQRQLLVAVDGMGSVAEVAERILVALRAKLGR